MWSHNWRHFPLPLEVVFRWFDEISRKHCKKNVWKVHSREPRQSCVQNSTQLQNFELTWENIYETYIQYDGINRKCQDNWLTSGINISFPRCDLIKEVLQEVEDHCYVRKYKMLYSGQRHERQTSYFKIIFVFMQIKQIIHFYNSHYEHCYKLCVH